MKIKQSTHLVIPLALVLLTVVGLTLFPVACTTPSSPQPAIVLTPSDYGKATPEPTHEMPWRVQLPLIVRASPPLALPPPSPTPAPLDFEAVRADLQARGQELAFVKIGFHVGPGGNQRGLGEYLEALAAAGVPAFIKSVDDYAPCAQALDYNPENITVFRLTGGDLELPDYNLPAEVSAEQHWARILDALPPGFDRRTWLEVMNEPDKERAGWLGRFAFHTAQLALRDGYKFAAFGWSSGEPEPKHWETPEMLNFLNLAAQHPEQIAVALHEYSYDVEDIANMYPYLVGRFQALFSICDRNDTPRPTVLITEWGWGSGSVPPPDQAMTDIAWASRLYAAYPQAKGAAIWYLGGGYGIADQAQRLILPLREYALRNYFVVQQDQQPADSSLFQ